VANYKNKKHYYELTNVQTLINSITKHKHVKKPLHVSWHIMHTYNYDIVPRVHVYTQNKLNN